MIELHSLMIVARKSTHRKAFWIKESAQLDENAYFVISEQHAQITEFTACSKQVTKVHHFPETSD